MFSRAPMKKDPGSRIDSQLHSPFNNPQIHVLEFDIDGVAPVGVSSDDGKFKRNWHAEVKSHSLISDSAGRDYFILPILNSPRSDVPGVAEINRPAHKSDLPNPEALEILLNWD